MYRPTRLAAILAVVAAAALSLVVTAAPAEAAADPFATATFYGQAPITAPATLTANTYTLSPDGRYGLILQPDGNLVEYGPSPCGLLQPDSCNGPYAWWSTGTAGQNGDRVMMQTDGNLVLYRVDNSVAWTTGTSGSGANHIVVDSTGAIYLERPNATVVKTITGTHLSATTRKYVGTITQNEYIYRWQYLSSPDGRYHLLVQIDGNIVLYGPAYHVLWSTKTVRESPMMFEVNPDGNVVGASGTPDGTEMDIYWRSNTGGDPGAYVSLQNDGNLVIYNPAHVALWATYTQGQI